MNLQKIPDKPIDLAYENRQLKAEIDQLKSNLSMANNMAAFYQERCENINSGVFNAGVFDDKFYSVICNRAYKEGYENGENDEYHRWM